MWILVYTLKGKTNVERTTFYEKFFGKTKKGKQIVKGILNGTNYEKIASNVLIFKDIEKKEEIEQFLKQKEIQYWSYYITEKPAIPKKPEKPAKGKKISPIIANRIAKRIIEKFEGKTDKSYEEIGKEFGVSRHTVSRIAKNPQKYGVKEELAKRIKELKTKGERK